MKPAPPLPKERQREQALKSLRLLDTAPEERFDRITRLAQRMFGVGAASVSFLDTTREWHKSSVGLLHKEVPLESSLLAYALHHDDVMVVEDTARDDRLHDHPHRLNEQPLRFYAACPLSVKGGIKVGALALAHVQPREFDADDRALLRDLARLVEQELEGRRLGNMDTLTQLSNRSGFEELAQHALNICRRFGKPATLLSFNVDGMRQINQAHGQVEGDLALAALGRIMIQTFRASDVVARLGNDEFVVLMTDTSQDNAQPAVQRLDAALAEYNRTSERGYDLAYSVGTLQYRPEVHPSVTGLLGAADMAMYERKRQKRKLLA